LAQKNITNIERRHIKQHLVFEGLDAIRQLTLLADAEITSLAEPSNGVGLWVRSCQQGQTLDNLCSDEVLMDTAINDEVQWSAFYPHL
jgi:hypothetical protein